MNEGDRFLPVRTSDGIIHAMGKLKAPTSTGDRFIIVRAADGTPMSVKCVAVNAEGQRGIPVMLADGTPSIVRFAADPILYAGGFFGTAGGVTVNCIAKWDGSSWSALGTGVAASAAPAVLALTSDSSGNLYAGGQFTTAGGVTANRIAKWDGSEWSALGTGVDNTLYALASDSSGNIYAGGFFTTAGGVTANRIAKWDGSEWSALGTGMWNDESVAQAGVYSLTSDSSGNVYAGGIFTTAGGVTVNGIAKWDGSTWSALGTGMDDSSDFEAVVLALTFDSSGNLYAGGQFDTAGGVSADRIAKWDGSSWSALGTGMHGVNVNSLTSDSSGNIYAGGNFTTAGGVTANRIAKWDGSAWSALGTGMNSAVLALAFDSSGNLYAGGQFTTAGGVTANRIAKWDGSEWSALGTGVDNTLYALAIIE